METVQVSRSWSDLPPEILEMILSRVPLSYHPYFASVCKSWNKIANRAIYPADLSPLLAYFKKWGHGILNCYSPYWNKTFKMDCPLDLSDTRLYSSQDGWLVFYRDFEVVLANPVTNILHVFPGLPPRTNFTGISLSGTPPNKCTIFAIMNIVSNFVLISTWHNGHWVPDIRFDNNLPFIVAPYSSPVEYHGCFICLSKIGKLGVYNLKEDTWYVLDKPEQFGVPCEECYLVKSEGELLAILVGNQKPPVQVLCLNRETMEWKMIDNLRSRSLFVGPGACCVTDMPKGMENKVFRSRLLGEPKTIEVDMRISDGRIFFVPKPCAYDECREECKVETNGGMYSYSLQNGKHSRYYGSVEYLYSIWYEPKLQESFTQNTFSDRCIRKYQMLNI